MAEFTKLGYLAVELEEHDLNKARDLTLMCDDRLRVIG